MSAREILEHLPKLSRHELEQVDSRVHELLTTAPPAENVWQALLEIAGTAEGLPSDLAEQHDHYLHGTSKR